MRRVAVLVIGLFLIGGGIVVGRSVAATSVPVLCQRVGMVKRLVVTRTDSIPQNHLHFSFPAEVTVTDASSARAVAAALCALPDVGSGTGSCPADFGIVYRLKFGERNGAVLPVVSFRATGCEFVHGLGPVRRAARSRKVWLALGKAMGLVNPYDLSGTMPHPTCQQERPGNCPVLSSPHLGQVAKDGDLGFTVTKVQCGVTHLGNGASATSAPYGSQWCLVSLTVANDGTHPVVFSAADQFAVEDTGARLSADLGAIVHLPNDARAAGTTIDPGARVAVVVPFYLRVWETIAKFRLHESAFSRGVTVLNET